jgi:peptidoglycan/xylan/chitin deacetylase (PgdA/CDA1 family)
MFLHQDKGDGLPLGTLCLTFDDGPGETSGTGSGPRTRDIGRFLHEEDIAATFFVLGQHAEQQRDLLRQLHAWGHLIGNHTFSHPGLVSLATTGGDVIGEIARTDAILRDVLGPSVLFLRPPYGNWREKLAANSPFDKSVSCVATLLNRSAQFPHYIGPINWDISSHDWEYWERGDPAKPSAAALLESIRSIGRGIVLLHDSSENERTRARNRTAEVTRLIVPALKRQGYRFVRLDDIPDVQLAMRRCQLLEFSS